MKNQEKFDRIGREWLKLHPCTNDSNTVYLPGKIDSVPIEVPIFVIDSALVQHQIDSIVDVYQLKSAYDKNACATEIKNSYQKGYSVANNEWKIRVGKIKVQTPRVDTIKVFVKDNQLIGLLNKDITIKDKQISDLNLSLSEMKGKKNKWFWWFIILLVLLGTSTYLNIKNKINGSR